MKKNLLPSFLLLIVPFFFNYVSGQYNLADGNLPAVFSAAQAGVAQIQSTATLQTLQWRYNQLKDEHGNFYAGYLGSAVQRADQMHMAGSRSGLGLNWQELGPDNEGGRTRALLIDKRDTGNQTIYAGGVSGGLWKSVDGGNTWVQLNNWNEWRTISCITQGPGPDYAIFVGTGEGLALFGAGSSFVSGSIGDGIFKLDASDNHTMITPEAYANNSLNAASPWSAVNRIAINPNNGNDIIAATCQGLWQTTDGGANWSAISITGITSGYSVSDVKWAPEGANVYACTGGNNYLVISRDSGNTWNLISATNNPGFPATEGRIEIAVAPQNGNIVYLSMATLAGTTYGALRSNDAGNTWQTIGLQGPDYSPFGTAGIGWFANAIAVSPADSNKIYVGGEVLYTWSQALGWTLADAGSGSGSLNPYYTSPGKHAIIIAPNNPDIMYIGTDSGIYQSTSAYSGFPQPQFIVKNRGYNVSLYYGMAAGIEGDVIGGAGDDGINYIDYTGNSAMAATQVLGGSGTFTAISHLDTRFYFGAQYYAQMYRSGDNAATFSQFFDLKIDPQNEGGPSACGGQSLASNSLTVAPFILSETTSAANGLKQTSFIADANYNSGDVITAKSSTAAYPFQYTLNSPVQSGDTIQVPDPVRSRIFLSSICDVWVTSDALNLGGIPKWFGLLPINGFSGTAQAMASTADGNLLYVATSSGNVYRFPNLNAACDTATYQIGDNVTALYININQFTMSSPATGRSIEGLAIDPANGDHIAITVAGFSLSNQPHVYESHDGGISWVADTSGLPNMPVYTVAIHDSATFIIGSELGIWSWNGSNWSEENNGYPRMPSYRLSETGLFSDDCKVLYLASFGRGMWRSTTLTPQVCQTTLGISSTGTTNSLNGLRIYPNPTTSSSKVSFSIENSGRVSLRIMDLSGKVWNETSYGAIKGENIFDLNTVGLAGGTYLVSASFDDKRTLSRLFTVIK